MGDLPHGTVTFLFTDIEGSTRLLRQLGERYAAVLEAHHRILREAAEARGGREVDNQGDSFFFAFPRANAALGTAVVAQRELAAHAWPGGLPVLVRMGLHTGEPTLGGDRYMGIGVHLAARIGAAAHGGQVLLSSATRGLVEEQVDDVSVRELGAYLLKDMERPERLYQLDITGLPSDFPPLRAEWIAPPRPLRRRAVLLSALAGVIAAAVAVPLFAFGGGGAQRGVARAVGDSVAFADVGTGRLLADVPVGTAPTAVAAGAGAVWVGDTVDGTVDRVDPATHTVRQTIRVGDGPSGVAFGDGSIWVTNGLSGTVSRIDPGTNSVTATIRVGNDPSGIVYARGAMWVANTGDDTVTRIDVANDRALRTIPVAASELAYGAGTVWVSERSANQVVRLDPSSGSVVAAIPVGNGPTGVAYGGGAAWVANNLDGTVSRIDPSTNAVVATLATGKGADGVAAAATGVWVGNDIDENLVRIDPRTNRVVGSFVVGPAPRRVAVSGGSVLVTVGQAGARHRGGTLRVETGVVDAGTVDPAVSYQATAWLLLRMTGDGLVAFNQTSGLPGTELVPDLALSLPRPTGDGRMYTFRLRSNIRFSNGRPVRARDVRSTFERDYSIAKLPVDYYDGIVGAAACRAHPSGCDLSRGIVTDDRLRTVTFHLVRPDPDFLDQLALPFAYVVPTGTPARELAETGVPGTGPYRIRVYRPQRRLVLVRNSYFREWSRAAQPDGFPNTIVAALGPSADRALQNVLRGRSDVLTGDGAQPSGAAFAQATSRFASRVHANPSLSLTALFMNTRVPPFDRVSVRRALNAAVDRAAFLSELGGSLQASPTCQILPPGLPGYRAYCPYRHDLARARALVAASGTRGMRVTVWGLAPGRIYSDYAVRLLRSLGYKPTLKLVPGPTQYFPAIDSASTHAQIGFFVWVTDYPAASAFVQPTFTCGASSNPSQFCDPRIDREIARAEATQAANPSAAPERWQRVDRDIVDEAPLVPLATSNVVTVLARRDGDFQYNPMWGTLIDQLWVR